MRIEQQKAEILTTTSYKDALTIVESAGRTCYKSKESDTLEGKEKFIRNIIKSGHESVVEHFNITFRLTTDRGVTHQLVRHRIASYSQESTRYCNYSKNKFGTEIVVIDQKIDPKSKEYQVWEEYCLDAENTYLDLIVKGVKPDTARSVLPTCLKTEIVMTANVREYRHFLKLRLDKHAHYLIRELAELMLKELKEKYPVFFEDL